jgi:predicted dehydrogenase
MEILNSGALGKILSARSKFEVGIGHTKKSRVFKKEVGGGSVLDIGVYPTSYTHMILGVPSEVKATAKMVGGVDVNCDTAFTYPCGAVVNFRVSTEPFTLKEHYIIELEKATVKIPSFFDARKVIIKHKDGKKEVLKGYGSRGKPDGFIWEIEHFNDLIRNGKKESPVMTHKATLEVVGLLEEQLRQVGYYD